MINVLSICGSPTPGSSTEFLLTHTAETIRDGVAPTKVRHRLIHLNDLDFATCQSCGEDPSPRWCFLDDDLQGVYAELARADCVLFGSPIYFDAVSAQAKAFIDRGNCFRPADFDNVDPEHDFIKRLTRERPGAIVLVGGEHAWFEGARRCIAGWFKWLEIVNEGVLMFFSQDFTKSGEAASYAEAVAEAEELGRHLGELLKREYG